MPGLHGRETLANLAYFLFIGMLFLIVLPQVFTECPLCSVKPNAVTDPQYQHAAQNVVGYVFTLTLLLLWKRERGI